MKDVQGIRLKPLCLSLATACALWTTAMLNQSTAQEPTFVPPAPVSEKTPANAAAEQPPLPPMTVETLKPELPEAAVTQPQAGTVTLLDGDWKMEIRPRGAATVNVDEKSYAKVYNSIPFRRSEYLANPSYRHDTTVEIMFGQMRPTVVHRQNSPQTVVNPRPAEYDPQIFREFEFWRNPGQFIQLLPGFGPVVAPRFPRF